MVAGGAIGAVARHLLTFGSSSTIPVGVLGANLAGAFLLGVLVEVLGTVAFADPRRRSLRLLLGTGVLGGFTTYSALTVDTAGLLTDGRTGVGVVYAIGSVIGGVVAAAAGILGVRAWTGRR